MDDQGLREANEIGESEAEHRQSQRYDLQSLIVRPPFFCIGTKSQARNSLPSSKRKH
jgi:hypothetical protein